MSHYTVLVIPEGTGARRRVRVSRTTARRSAWVLGVFAVFLVALTIDYVRVRIDVVELDALRVETRAQREQLDAVAGSLTELEDRLGKLSEFERKVRIMADLPSAVAGRGDGIVGVGGGERAVLEPAELAPPEEPEAVSSSDAAAPPAPQAALAIEPEGPSDISRAAALRHRGARLNRRAIAQEATLSDLVEGLEGKRLRLASTPSIWPARGWLTSRFGYRISPFTGRRQLHAGVDLAAEPGTEIIAPARGRVIFAGRKGHLGNAIVIDHGFRMRTTYGHAKKLYVTAGQRVERGQLIASIGSTGRATGPHLHYAVQVSGRTVNPLNYILE